MPITKHNSESDKLCIAIIN